MSRLENHEQTQTRSYTTYFLFTNNLFVKNIPQKFSTLIFLAMSGLDVLFS